jgi:hypothetical protein
MYKGASAPCHVALPNGITKSDVGFLLARAIWQRFANWLARLISTSVGPNQRNPSGNTSRWHMSA